jgi:hypothetical protein
MSDQPPHVPMGEGYPPHEEGQHVVGPTCSSGCAQYGNRDGGTSSTARLPGSAPRTAHPTPRKHRAERKAERQNRKRS